MTDPQSAAAGADTPLAAKQGKQNDLDSANQAIVNICLKGKAEPIRLEFQEDTAVEIVEVMVEHVRKHGFRGWRGGGAFILNMEEVQAAWVSSPLAQPEKARMGGEGKE